MWSVSGVMGRISLLGRTDTDGQPIHVADLADLTGSINNGYVQLRGRVVGRPYRCAVGVAVRLDFATAPVRRAGVLRCYGTITHYAHPLITFVGQDVIASPIKSLTS